MDAIFINHTNHKSEQWSAEQRAAAERFGRIVDLPFPDIHPDWGEVEIAGMAVGAAARIVAMKPEAVLCQGEFTYTSLLVYLLKLSHITVLAASSERRVKEWQDEAGRTKRESTFCFVRFRPYI